MLLVEREGRIKPLSSPGLAKACLEILLKVAHRSHNYDQMMESRMNFERPLRGFDWRLGYLVVPDVGEDFSLPYRAGTWCDLVDDRHDMRCGS